MAGNEASWAITLPPQFAPLGDIMQQGLGLKERQNEKLASLYEAKKTKAESDQWKKLGLIRDLTDLSSHQTGNDVANAIGNKMAADIFQKYTTQADKMSPIELQANIQKDMSGAIQGMEGVKNELTTADKQIAAIKAEYPDLNISQLAQDARADILHRRLDNTGGFANPLTVPPSSINLADPDYISRYVTGDKNLRTFFQNPQGLDPVDVYSGDRTNYTKYTAKIPPWKKPNFDPSTLNGGFMTTKGEPQLQFKSSTLPSTSLPSSQGKPFEMIDKDVYDQLGGKEKIELTALTRKAFPNYDQMNPTEKEYAQRHAYLQAAKSLDQTNFHPTEVHTPSASLLKLEGFGSGNNGTNDYYNAYKSIQGAVSDARNQGVSYLTGSLLNSPQSDLAVSEANKKYPELKLSQDDIKVGLDDEGKVQVFYSDKYLGKHPRITNPLITTLDEREMNVKGNQTFGVKTKKVANAAGNKDMQGVNSPIKSNGGAPKMYEYNGKTFNEQKIASAALQSGKSLEQYLKDHPEIKIK